MKALRSALPVLVLSLLAFPAPAQTAGSLQAEATEAMRSQHLPSISVAIYREGSGIVAFALGEADLERHIPATPESLYRIASITKPMTAVAALQLTQSGKLNLDAPAETLCPAFTGHPQITARMLLSHRSGLPFYDSDAQRYNTTHYASVPEAAKMIAHLPLKFAPGAGYQYSSYGFTIAGCEIEGASATPYAEYIRQHVLALAQMKHTFVDDASTTPPKESVAFYSLEGDKLVPAPRLDSSDRLPGGGWLSTPTDLVRFASSLPALLPAEWRERMWSETTHEGEGSHYGLGWALTTISGARAVEHAGGQAGTSTSLLYLPSKGLAIAVFTNREGADMTKLSHHWAEELLAAH